MKVLANVYICHPKKKSASLLPEGTVYTTGTIANWQRMPTDIDKNGANAKVNILMEQVIMYGI